MIQVQKLDEQTSLIMETVAYTETVSVGFWFLSGSRDEEQGQQGSNHCLEHMLFKGTEKRSAFQIASEIDRVGGVINAFTDKENSCYYCTVPSESLPLALDVLADMVFHSVLAAEELEKEKSVILNEITAAMDSPEDLAHELFIRQLWKKHPLSRKITGEIADVIKINREKLYSFYKGKYIHSRLIISIAGKLDPDRTLDSVRQLLGSVRRQGAVSNRQPPQPTYSTSFVKSNFKQVQIYAGTQLPGLPGLADYYVFLIISTIIGESLSSRLFQKIREEKGLCYSIYTYRTFFTDTALWMIYSNTAREYVLPLLETLNSELKTISGQLITAGEIADAKSHLKGNLILAREDMESRMKRLARLLLLTGQPIEFDVSFGYIDNVSLADVNVSVEKLIRSDQFHLLTFGNKKKINWKGFRLAF